jgi:hypothetical protein
MAAIPGDTTANPATSVQQQTVMGRCPRCERWPWEQNCGGVAHS